MVNQQAGTVGQGNSSQPAAQQPMLYDEDSAARQWDNLHQA
jgi:hypothetical protein